MATWAEFDAAAPQLASKGRALLYQYGPPLGYLATVRPDGGPQPTAGLRAAIISAALAATVGADEEDLFQLHIDRVLLANYTHRGQWPPSYQLWAASDG